MMNDFMLKRLLYVLEYLQVAFFFFDVKDEKIEAVF